VARTEGLRKAVPPGSFTGTWKTLSGGSYPYTVILKQTGNKVTGSYSPGNGVIREGVVVGNKVTFKWTQDNGYEGTGEFTLDKTGKGFTGSSTASKPKQFTVTWNTYVPTAASFNGTWDTISAGRYAIPLTISQNGTSVTGVYPGNNGKIEGTVSGKVLRFKWRSDGGTGSGRFIMDESGTSFSGTFNRGNNPDDVDSTWNGKRPEAGGGKTVPPAPLSFSGAWQGTMGGSSLLLLLQHKSDKVTGQLKLNSADFGVLTGGVVTGKTLRFAFLLPNGQAGGNGELVMDAGGKSFQGNINGTAATATFLGP
jgi:hypothetical protein